MRTRERRYLVLIGLAIAGLAVVVGCGEEELNPGRARARNPAGSINATGRGAGTGAATGLPCNVQQLLEARCIGCHLGPSPVALLTYEDLVAPAPGDPTKTVADRSLLRMQDRARPMPPAPAEAPSADELAILTGWISAKLPRAEACTGVDGGVPVNPYAGPTVCTSNTRWTRGDDEGSSNMKPGGACMACHAREGGKVFTIAGTVYPTAHEPDDCNGANGAAAMTIVVTDANGLIVNARVNGVGNFSARAAIVPPFRVKVTDGARERAMVGTLTAGDCNTCHTEQGVNGAPGRIIAP